MTDKIQKLLTVFPVVALVGARQTGKTTLAKQLKPHWHYIDLEKPADYDLMQHDPTFFFQRHPDCTIIDEAQVLPTLFNTLRGVIDENRSQKGRFIITGSSSPELLGNISETLAGRIGIVHIAPFKANELFQKPLSTFYQLFAQTLSREALPTTKAPLSQAEIHQAWFKGGYPEPVLSKNKFFYEQWMQAYQQTYLNRDIAQLFPRLNQHNYRRFLTMLSHLSGSIINKSEVSRALEVSQPTVSQYLEIAQGTFLWHTLPSFERNVQKAIVKMPKGYLCDSGLLHYLLKIPTLDDLYKNPIVGASFESFVIEELLRGIAACDVVNCQAFYYRTRNGGEIDCILDGPFGILPIEIKYGSHTKLSQLHTLSDFIKTHGLDFGLLINQAQTPGWLTPHIYQLPVGWL